MQAKRFIIITLLLALLLVLPLSFAPLAAQEEGTTSELPPLLLTTEYPGQVVGAGETATLELTLQTGTEAQIAELSIEDLPENWEATFRGGNRIVQSVYVRPGAEATVNLRVDVPADVEPGRYTFTVIADGEREESRLPITLTVQERVPASLTLEAELPMLRGRPDTTFRYNVDLNNEGDEEITVNLSAEAPSGFLVTFKSAGQEVTSLPVEGGGSERVSVEVELLFTNETPSDRYPIEIIAQSDTLEARTTLVAEVVGESQLTLTTPDERLSGQIRAGQETPLTLVALNTGSAPARNISLSASPPSGWSVTFEPETIVELQPGERLEVTARVQPADNALAGDYVLTFRATPEGSGSESVEYRATVRTSTMWGIAGVALIAVAVGVVGLAVSRFGRR